MPRWAPSTWDRSDLVIVGDLVTFRGEDLTSDFVYATTNLVGKVIQAFIQTLTLFSDSSEPLAPTQQASGSAKLSRIRSI